MSGLHAAFEERLGSAGFEAYADSDDGLGSIMARIEAARLPVVAAINGYAVSGGLEVALCCDVRLAATHAQFACSGVNVGLILSWFRLPRVVGLGRAKEMLLSGAMYDAEQAERWGLVTGLHEPDKLVPAALALAEQIATRAPLSVEATEGVRQHGFNLSIAEAMALQRERPSTFKRRKPGTGTGMDLGLQARGGRDQLFPRTAPRISWIGAFGSRPAVSRPFVSCMVSASWV